MRSGELFPLPTPALRTCGSGSGYLPTPDSRDWKDTGATQGNRHSPNLGTVAHWPTPRAGNPGSRPNRKGGKILSEEVKKSMGMIPTPRAEDSQSFGAHRGTPDTLTAFTKMWPTPGAAKANNDTSLTCSGDGREKPNKLGWAVAAEQQKEATTIEEARMMGAGNGGKLNPTWVEWLMGFPLGWTVCEAWETRSSRRSRKSSGGQS